MTLATFMIHAAGVVEGVVLATVLNRVIHTEIGILRIDHSNPEKDVYRLDIENLDNLSKKKRVVLRVDNSADLSQK